jgi:predicted Zn-dependent protease
MSAATGGTLNAAKLDPKVTVAAMTAMGVAYEGATMKPFAKEQELEADRNALVIMAQAGFNHRAAVTYLEKFAEPPSGIKQSFLDDHPSVMERIAAMETNMAKAEAIYQKTKG